MSVSVHELRERPHPEIDATIVARLCELPEERILDYFWLMHRKGAEPLLLLLQLTAVTVKRPPSWNPAAIRREHELYPDPRTPARRACFSCGDAHHALYSHHVIEVYHGGSNTPRNKVPLCFACHQYLHPWLKDEPAPSQVRGFKSLYDIMRGAGRKL